MSATASTPESSSTPAAAPTPAPAPGTDPAVTALDAQLTEFARDWLGIELGAEERARVRGAIAMLEAQQRMQASQAAQASAGGAARRPAGSVIDLDRQRIQNLIDHNLSRTQATVLGNARAERAAETAVLGAVERAQSLDDLRPPKPAAGANQAPRTDPLIAQIADQLTGLIKREVDACFQQQFGPLANQLQAVIDAAQDSGLLARKSDSASSHESRGTAENSGKPAQKPDQNNNHNNAATAPASASQRD